MEVSPRQYGTFMGWDSVLVTCLFIFSSLSAFAESIISVQLEKLPDGEYIYASQLPKLDRHPEIRFAGAEVFAFRKKGKKVFGEQFIANTSEAGCFRGTIMENILNGELLFYAGPGQGSLQSFKMQINLGIFYPIEKNSISYAQGSIERCQQVVKPDRLLR